MKKLFLLLTLVSMPVFASGGGAHLDEVDIDMNDTASLQRGAGLFVNYCLSCHSAAFMRYNRMAEDLQIPDNIELDFTEEDPLVNWFFGFAKEQGFSQETVNKALNEYVKIEMANMPDVGAEIEKLGDHGQDRMLRVHNWLEGRLSDTQFAAINPLLSSAAQVEALEVLMKSTGPSDFDGDGGGSPLSLEELREMQKDKRYWQEKNPAFIKKVQDGYERLYKGQ